MKSKKEIINELESLKERAKINGRIIWHRINPRLWGRIRSLEWVLDEKN